MLEKIATRNKPSENPTNIYQGGLVDLFLGWVALVGGVGLLSGLAYLGGIALPMFIPVWQSIRQKVTNPQPGNLNQRRSNMNRFIAGFLTGLLALVLVFLFTQENNSLPTTSIRQYILIVVGIILAVLIGSIGAVFHINRLFAYSGLLLVLFGAGYKFNFDLGWILTIFGVLVMCCGSVVLVRFIQQNPVQA